MFAIVEFISGEDVAVIPTIWFCSEEEDECFWPTSHKAVSRMVMLQEKPQKSWQRYKIRVLGKAGAYERAREKLSMSEVTSDLQTDTETEKQPRKKRRTSRYVSSESESDDENAPLQQKGTSAYRGSKSVHKQTSQPGLHQPPPPPLPKTSGSGPRSPSLARATGSCSTSSQRRLSTPLGSLSIIRPTSSASPPSPRSPSPPRSLSPLLSTSASSSPSRAPVMGTPTTCTPTTCTTLPLNDRASLQRLLSIMEGIRENQRIHGAMLKTVLTKLSGKETDIALEVPDGASFPLTSKAELDALDAELAGDSTFRVGLVNLLSDLGGRNLDEFIKRVMTYLVENQLALGMNFIGRNNKLAFGDYKLFDVVHRAMKKNEATSGCNKHNAERAVSKWLQGARDRDGNRNTRRQPPQAPPQAPLPNPAPQEPTPQEPLPHEG